MSALPPKADIGTQSREVRFVPEADIMQCIRNWRYSITSSARASSDCAQGLQMGSVPDNDELSYVLISAAEIDFGLHPLMALPETAGV